MSKQKNSSNHLKDHYLKPGFWNNPDHQFWNSLLYTDAYRERMQKLIREFDKKNMTDLIW